MELMIVLITCAVAALVIHWIVRPMGSRRPPQDSAEHNR
jgi:hypothetical protein